MEIDASDKAKEFIVEQGGNVYVWSSEAGFDHATTKLPDAAIEFVSTEADGFTFHQDATIDEPDFWRIEFHHFPHHHVTATWDGGEFAPPGIFGHVT
jgi:hypothetical protein